MSAARDFLADLDRHGVKIVPTGDGLRLVPPTGRPVPPDLVARGRQLKPALLELLRQPSDATAEIANALDAAESYAERVAIATIDGGLPASHAALLAAAQYAPLREGETLEAREADVIHYAKFVDAQRKRREAGR